MYHECSMIAVRQTGFYDRGGKFYSNAGINLCLLGYTFIQLLPSRLFSLNPLDLLVLHMWNNKITLKKKKSRRKSRPDMNKQKINQVSETTGISFQNEFTSVSTTRQVGKRELSRTGLSLNVHSSGNVILFACHSSMALNTCIYFFGKK